MTGLLLLSWAPAQMWLQILLLIVGIIVVLKGADWLTDGASGVAERLGMPQIIIGLTVVAMGTSMPEFFVSLMSAINGTPDLAVGNIVGSNIFNALFIVGCAAMVAPIAIQHSTVKRDIPVAVFASVLLMAMMFDSDFHYDGHISRIDAAIMLIAFIIYMWCTLRGAKNGESDSEQKTAKMSILKAIGLVLAGLVCLIFGSSVFVDNASALAHSIGISDAVIGLTIVAGGTSLPELATSVVAAKRGNSGIAIGNVLGSNVFNILMILGVTGLITPMTASGITMVDLSMMVISMVMLWLFSFTKYRIQRWEGAVLTIVFIGYIAWLVANV